MFILRHMAELPVNGLNKKLNDLYSPVSFPGMAMLLGVGRIIYMPSPALLHQSYVEVYWGADSSPHLPTPSMNYTRLVQTSMDSMDSNHALLND
jgi:hypothetical protein